MLPDLEENSGFNELEEAPGLVELTQEEREGNGEEIQSHGKTYQKAELEKTILGNSDEFLSFAFTQRQLGQIHKIVEAEVPILKSLLGKRLLEAWGITRLGGRLQRRLDDLLKMADVKITQEPFGEDCFWSKDQSPMEYADYRVFGEGDFKRNVEEIPTPELINGLTYVLRQMVSLPEDDLIREGAREFGYFRTGNQVKEKMGIAIQTMIKQGLAKEIDGRIKLIG